MLSDVGRLLSKGRHPANRTLTLSYLPFCDILCDSSKTIIGLSVNICQIP